MPILRLEPIPIFCTLTFIIIYFQFTIFSLCHDLDSLNKFFIFLSIIPLELTFVSAQEYKSVLSKLQSLNGKFMALEKVNQCLLGGLQKIAIDKQQHEKLTSRAC